MLQSICFPGFSTLKVPKLIRQLPLVCNFPGHPPSLVHRGSADPGETGLFFTVTANRVQVLPKTELKPATYELHGWSWQGTPFCPLSNTSDSSHWSLPFLPAKLLSPPQDKKSKAVSISSPSPFSGEGQLFFPSAYPFLHQFRRHFLKTRRLSTNSCLIIWKMGRVLWPTRSKRQHLQDVISNEMAFQGGVSPFFLSPSPSVIQGLKWVYWFPWSRICKTGKSLQPLPSRYEEAARHHISLPRLQWDCHPCSTWIKYCGLIPAGN